MKKFIIPTLCGLFTMAMSASAQQDISIEVVGVQAMPAHTVGQVRVNFNNNSDALSFGGANGSASVRIDFDYRYIDVSAAATGAQDLLPAGWTVTSVTQNATTSRIIVSMGNDEIPALDGRSFYIRFRSKTTLVSGNKFIANIMYINGIQPNGNSTDNDGAAASITINSVLPVVFGDISAVLKNGILSVNWSTESEKNNSRFIIEASKDGQNFVAIDSIQTQALNGNCDKTVQYSFSKALNATVSMLGVDVNTVAVIIIALLTGLLMWFTYRKNWYKRGAASMIVALTAIALLNASSCKKKQDEMQVEKDVKIWVRITQVDVDGTRISSKIIKAIRE